MCNEPHGLLVLKIPGEVRGFSILILCMMAFTKLERYRYLIYYKSTETVLIMTVLHFWELML